MRVVGPGGERHAGLCHIARELERGAQAEGTRPAAGQRLLSEETQGFAPDCDAARAEAVAYAPMEDLVQLIQRAGRGRREIHEREPGNEHGGFAAVRDECKWT